MKKNLRQVGDSIFNKKKMSQLTKRYPYQSFVVMSAALEFLGKCYERNPNFQESGHSKTTCENVINALPSLQEYKCYSDLYHTLRCGMLHAFTPNGIVLTRGDGNDAKKNMIGARKFCEDLRKAWEELKQIPECKKYLLGTEILEVTGTVSGSTLTQS